MTESEHSGSDEKLRLEIEKLQKEIEKLTVEIPKIVRESGWRATVMPSIVSVAAVLVTAAVGIDSFISSRQTLRNAVQTQNFEQEKANRELALNCVTSASVVAKEVLDRAKDFDGFQIEGKINFVNTVLATYPPPVADRFLNALAPRIKPTDTGSKTALTLAIERAEHALATPEAFPCPAVTDLIPLNVGLPQSDGVLDASPIGSPPDKNASAPSGPANPPAVAPETVVSSLTAYYQVTREADRALAMTVGSEVAAASAGGPGTSFPSAGVEVVAAALALRQIEIRYYHREQEDAAKQLLDYVQNAAHQQTGRTVFIGGSFPNLPQGRIEVWLPPAEQAAWGAAFCYQEKDPRKPPALRFLVLCQPSMQACGEVRGHNPDTSQSPCVAVDLTRANWKPIVGTKQARYQFAPAPFGEPFPQL